MGDPADERADFIGRAVRMRPDATQEGYTADPGRWQEYRATPGLVEATRPVPGFYI